MLNTTLNTPAANMQLKHIDNSFYRLTAKQAKTLCDGKLPRPGYEKAANPALLPQVTLLCRGNSFGQWLDFGHKASNAKSAYVTRTALSYHDGRQIKSGMVWALHLYFQP